MNWCEMYDDEKWLLTLVADDGVEGDLASDETMISQKEAAEALKDITRNRHPGQAG